MLNKKINILANKSIKEFLNYNFYFSISMFVLVAVQRLILYPFLAKTLGTEDFGWAGVLFSIFMVGIIIHLFYWKILTVSEYSKNIIFTTIIASIVPIFTFGFISSNFTTLFFTRGLILVVILLFVIPKLFNQKTMRQTGKN